jgi:hypothetical protein
MQTEIRELPRTEVPRPLIYATAVTCGVLAAMAVQILLGTRGIELAGMWRNLLSTQALQLRSAGAWWLLVMSSILVGAMVAAALSRLPLPWHDFRLPRWIMSALVVFALAETGHLATTAITHSPGAQIAVTLTALGAAALMSFFGAYFAVKR